METGNAMAAAMISRLALGATLLALLPFSALAQAPATRAPNPTAPAPEASNSRWMQLPNILLEDVLYPVAAANSAAPVSQVLATTSSTLRSGHTVIATTVKLENPEPRAASVRPVDYVRCYEYFTPNFSQDGTRCFVLQPRK
jgi:hypothetical protein